MTREEAMAKAKEFMATHTRPNEDQFEREAQENEFARRFMFEADFDDWLRLRASISDDAPTDEELARGSHEWELAQRILSTPAVYDWMVFQKFEVINHYITKHGEASPMELMALMALDGIKADLLRFELMKERRLAARATVKRC